MTDLFSESEEQAVAFMKAQADRYELWPKDLMRKVPTREEVLYLVHTQKRAFASGMGGIPDVPKNWDLTGIDLSGIDLSGAWFYRANFQGARFAGAGLRGVSFREADLREVDFTGAVLIDAGFQHADITDAGFRYANLTGANLHYTRGIRANFEGARLGAVFTNANLSDANFRGAKPTRSTKLGGAVLTGAKFQNVDLSRVPRLGVMFYDADLTGAVLQRPRTRPSTIREDPVWAVEWSHKGLMGCVSVYTITRVHAVVAPNAEEAAKAVRDLAVKEQYMWVHTTRVELVKRQRMRLSTRNPMRNQIHDHVWSPAAVVVELTGGRNTQ